MIKEIMRKQMRRIVAITALVVLIICTFASWINIRNSEIERSETVFRQVDSVLKDNSAALKNEEEAYSASSLGNARTVAYILQYHPEARDDRKELQKICSNLEIDEIHIFDEKGVIIQGTQPQYYGYSFDSGEQMGFFKPLLKDKSLELVQDVTPNTAAGKMEQYSALWSEDGTFIVEVGMHPERVLQIKERNELPYIFHMVGAGGDSELYAVNPDKKIIEASTVSDKSDQPMDELGLSVGDVKNRHNGFFAKVNGKYSFCVSRDRGDYYLVKTVSAYSLLEEMLMTEIFLLAAVFIVFVFLSMVVTGQVDKNVINPIHRINESLRAVSDGKYNTRVEKQSSQEFSELADYVNEMTASIEEHVSTVHYQSRHDMLTGVWNRNALQLKLSKMRTQKASAAILYADLNGLKKINDDQGHDRGDQAIKAVADSLVKIFGKSVVYRAGGDEFVVFDENSSEGEFRRKVSVLNIAWENAAYSLSTGMAFCRSMEEIDQRMIEADAAMYAMKRKYYERHSKSGMRASDARLKRKPDDSVRETYSVGNLLAAHHTSDKPVWMERLEELFKAFSVVAEDKYVFLCDMRHDYSIWSRNAVDTFGLPDTNMEHAAEIWERCIHPDDIDDYHKSIELIFSGEMASHDMQYRARERNGKYDMCTCRGLVLRDDAGNPLYFGGSITNHTLEDRIDPLTGLMNQDGFFQALKGLMQNHQEAVVLMFGTSDFSEVNSLYGYEFGNRVIHKMAGKFASELANLGDYFRLDGTQSILISHDVPADMLEVKYNELKTWLYEELEVEGNVIPLRLNGALMKLNQFEADDSTVFVCLNSAYQTSKRDKQGELVVFDDIASGITEGSLKTIGAIRRSLSRSYDDFEMYYQPIMKADTEEIGGAEALIRWHNDEFDYVSPDKFMPILENDTQFYALGLWIIRQTLTDGLRMVKKYPDFRLQINLSYKQVEMQGFAHDVIGLITETGFPAQNLCLEITEHCRLVDKKLISKLISALRDYGVKFALDDFGTGYSSANVLHELDLDVIKIDKSFVWNVEKDERAKEALKNYIELAHIYDAESCVEGIESEGMRDIAREYGVDCLQGYLYSRPVCYDDFCSKYDI